MSGQGTFYSLAREDAKQLFALKAEADIRNFLIDLRNSRRYRENDLILEVGEAWDPIHRCLTDGTLDPDGGEFPNNECVLGGRSLCRETNYLAKLVRPDETPYIAESLAKIRRDELHARYFAIDPVDYGRPLSEEEFTNVWIAFKLIRDFYADAAEERAAVVFAAELTRAELI